MFTIEEITIIKMYSGLNPTRQRVIQQIEELIPLVDTLEIKELCISSLEKLKAISDDAFEEIDFSQSLI